MQNEADALERKLSSIEIKLHETAIEKIEVDPNLILIALSEPRSNGDVQTIYGPQTSRSEFGPKSCGEETSHVDTLRCKGGTVRSQSKAASLLIRLIIPSEHLKSENEAGLYRYDRYV